MDDGFPRAVVGQARNDLPFGHHLPALHPHIGDHPVAIGPQHRVGATVFNLAGVRLGGGEFCFGDPQVSRGLVENLP